MIPHRAILSHEGNSIKMDFRRSLMYLCNLARSEEKIHKRLCSQLYTDSDFSTLCIVPLLLPIAEHA